MRSVIQVLAWLSVVISLGSAVSPPEYDGFKARFKMFQTLPRTVAEAQAYNFTKVADCTSHPKFRGNQYMNNNDPAIILLFDKQGFIAGVQGGIAKDIPNGYPKSVIQPPFTDDGNMFRVTVYFVDPSIICTKGRTAEEFQSQGTAHKLIIQEGDDPLGASTELARNETDTNWVKGKCFPKMGFHFFKDLTPDMECDRFYPIAALYYKGLLRGFVWSFGALLNSTYLPYERPEPDFFEELMDEVPPCFETLRRSTMHFYLDDKPEDYVCDDDSAAGVTTYSPVHVAGCVAVSVFFALSKSYFGQ